MEVLEENHCCLSSTCMLSSKGGGGHNPAAISQTQHCLNITVGKHFVGGILSVFEAACKKLKGLEESHCL